MDKDAYVEKYFKKQARMKYRQSLIDEIAILDKKKGDAFCRDL